MQPNNNQAPTTNYNQALASFGSVYDPQVAAVQGQQTELLNEANTNLTRLSQDQATTLSSLEQAKRNAFSNNSLASNARGLFYSGYAPAQNNAYTTNTYNPNLEKANTDYQRNVQDTHTKLDSENQSLLDKINAINQSRANDAYSLVENTKQAQLSAAKARASGGGSGGSGGSGRSGGSGGSGGSGKAGKAFDLTTVAAGTLQRQLTNSLRSVEGRDGHVSPENLAKAFNTWRAAGLDTNSFWKHFQGVWNPKQGNYQQQFNYFVSKGA